MPGTPTPGRMAIPADLADMQRQIAALSTQQTQVITDPTGATGDPTHGHATTVIGALQQITGIAGFGVAVYIGTSWRQVANSLAVDGTGALKMAVGFQAFTGLSVAPNVFPTVTITHNIGYTPSIFFPFFSCQDGGFSIPVAEYTQGNLTSTTIKATLVNSTNVTCTNAQIGWMIVHN